MRGEIETENSKSEEDEEREWVGDEGRVCDDLPLWLDLEGLAITVLAIRLLELARSGLVATSSTADVDRKRARERERYTIEMET